MSYVTLLFCTNISSFQRIKPPDFGDPLTFLLVATMRLNPKLICKDVIWTVFKPEIHFRRCAR